jgi:hypothetical protein
MQGVRIEPVSVAGCRGQELQAPFWSDSQRQVTQTLASLSDSDLDKMVRHTSGGQRSVHHILAGLINEQVHHGAEISLLRDLYRIGAP